MKNFTQKLQNESVSENRFPFKLNETNAKRIVGVACDEWKFRLSKEWGPALLTNGYVTITEHRYKEMRQACTSSQHKLFDEIFGSDEPTCPYKDGELIFVRDDKTHTWCLRYAAGTMYNDNVVAYCNQNLSGDTNVWKYHAPAPGVKLPE